MAYLAIKAHVILIAVLVVETNYLAILINGTFCLS